MIRLHGVGVRYGPVTALHPVNLAVPLALAAARNTAPHPLVHHAARIVLNFFRAVPELIMGIVILAAVTVVDLASSRLRRRFS
jgi:ABC-type phosphate/phosphonate transport system permease subunit